MKTYKIATVWQMWGTCAIEADSLEAAKEEVLSNGQCLPTGDYIDDSQEIDHEGCEEMW